MRLLFEMDQKDYKEGGTVFKRPSARGIIIHGNKVAMIYSPKFDYYKFPGGGIEENDQTPIDALIREVKEEAGLTVIPDSIREYGLVRRMQKGLKEDIFIQENLYYFCDASEIETNQDLDEYEADEGFVLQYVDPIIAIQCNRKEHDVNEMYKVMLEREVLVLEQLIKDQYF